MSANVTRSPAECSICCEPYSEEGQKTPFSITSCGHTYCKLCLDKLQIAITTLKTCPVCRIPIKEIVKNFGVTEILQNLKTATESSKISIIDSVSTPILAVAIAAPIPPPSPVDLPLFNSPARASTNNEIKFFLETPSHKNLQELAILEQLDLEALWRTDRPLCEKVLKKIGERIQFLHALLFSLDTQYNNASHEEWQYLATHAGTNDLVQSKNRIALYCRGYLLKNNDLRAAEEANSHFKEASKLGYLPAKSELAWSNLESLRATCASRALVPSEFSRLELGQHLILEVELAIKLKSFEKFLVWIEKLNETVYNLLKMTKMTLDRTHSSLIQDCRDQRVQLQSNIEEFNKIVPDVYIQIKRTIHLWEYIYETSKGPSTNELITRSTAVKFTTSQEEQFIYLNVHSDLQRLREIVTIFEEQQAVLSKFWDKTTSNVRYLIEYQETGRRPTFTIFSVIPNRSYERTDRYVKSLCVAKLDTYDMWKKDFTHNTIRIHKLPTNSSAAASSSSVRGQTPSTSDLG